MSFVPSSVRLPPTLKEISSSVIGRRNATIYPSTGSINYGPTNRLITFNVSSEQSLLDTDKLYFEFDAVISKNVGVGDNTADRSDYFIPNNSAESFIDRVVVRVGSKVIADTSYSYQKAESMFHHWTPLEYANSAGSISGISAVQPGKILSVSTITEATGVPTADGNNSYGTRALRFNNLGATISTGFALGDTLLKEKVSATTASITPCLYTAKFIVPIRLVGFLDQVENLLPLWTLDNTIALSIDIYLSAAAQCMSIFNPSGAEGGTATLGSNVPNYIINNALMTADYVDISEDYKQTLNSFLFNGGVLSIPSSEVNIYEFSITGASGVPEASVQLGASYKDLQQIYLGFFNQNTLNSPNFNGEDMLIYPNLASAQIQIGSKYWPSDQPLDCTGRATRAYQQTAKAFSSQGIEGMFGFDADNYVFPVRGVALNTLVANQTPQPVLVSASLTAAASSILTRTESPTYFVLGWNFESVIDDDESTIKGIDTSMGQGVITIRLKGNPLISTNTNMVVICKYKQVVNVQQNYQVDRQF